MVGYLGGSILVRVMKPYDPTSKRRSDGYNHRSIYPTPMCQCVNVVSVVDAHDSPGCPWAFVYTRWITTCSRKVARRHRII